MTDRDWNSIKWFGREDVKSWEFLEGGLLSRVNMMAGILLARPVFLSTYRDPEHNQKVGGAKDSWHVKGGAADVTFPGKTLEEMYKAAVDSGFLGIGIYPDNNFVHVDVRSKAGTWARIKGAYQSLAVGWDYLKKKGATVGIGGAVIVTLGIGIFLMTKRRRRRGRSR
jgi:hypothetical protein